MDRYSGVACINHLRGSPRTGLQAPPWLTATGAHLQLEGERMFVDAAFKVARRSWDTEVF